MKTISLDSISDPKSPEDKEQDKQVQAGRIAAISWLGLARKPSGQVAARLKGQGFTDDTIRAVLKSLQEDGYLDDQAIALRLIRQRQGRQAESKRALTQRMQQMGLPDEVVLASFSDEWSDLTAACQLIENRFGDQIFRLSQEAFESGEAADRKTLLVKMWAKTGRFLSSRGFSQETIYQALHKYFSSIDMKEDNQA